MVAAALHYFLEGNQGLGKLPKSGHQIAQAPNNDFVL